MWQWTVVYDQLSSIKFCTFHQCVVIQYQYAKRSVNRAKTYYAAFKSTLQLGYPDKVIWLNLINLLLPHLFSLLCEGGDSYETPPMNSVLRLIPWQFSLGQVVLLLMLSNHLRFGLPLLLFPGTSITITLLPTYSYSLRNTCPYHFNLRSCTFLDISPTFVVPPILSFQILSSLVTPLIHLNILIPATSNFFSCAFFTAHVSAPYTIAGLTTVLYTFPWLSNLFFRHTESPIPSSHFD